MAPLLDEDELLAVGVELGADRLLELDEFELCELVVVVSESSPLVVTVVVAGVVVVEVVVVLWW